MAQNCLALGVAHSNGAHGLPVDEKTAADMYERACDLGDIRGCNNLAVALEKGQGRAVDSKGAAQIYARNCSAGHALACRNLGRSHRDGLGVPVDPGKAKAAFASAKKLSEKACSAGVAEGCSNLGFMFRTGMRSPTDNRSFPRAPPAAGARADERACWAVGRVAAPTRVASLRGLPLIRARARIEIEAFPRDQTRLAD